MSGGNLTATLINAPHLNVRSGPGMSFELFAYLSSWQVVELSGYRNAGGGWIEVVLPDGRTGWAAARFLTGNFSFWELLVDPSTVD